EIAAELRQSRRSPGPLMLFEGKILDGRHRYFACQKAGVEPFFRHYGGKNPRAFVIRNNIARRHLTTEQRPDPAAKLATRPLGRPKTRSTDGVSDQEPMSTAEAANLMKVSESSVRRAKARQAGRQTQAG